MRSRRKPVAAGVVLAAVAIALLVWVWRREPAWTVSLEADATSVTPWRDVLLRAHVKPAGAIGEGDHWTWTWEVDGSPLEKREPRLAWRSGDLGDHTLSVTVQSPWGTRRTASVSIDVHQTAYVSPVAGRVEPKPPVPPPPGLPFEIADVWIEKDEVCQGEPSRIRMTARDSRGDGELKWLTPVIDGKQTWENTFIASLSEPGVRMVPISVTDSRLGERATVSTEVFILVKDCVARFPLFLQHEVVAPDESYIAFDAQMFDGPAWHAWATGTNPAGGAPLALAAAYRWTFGDGTSTTTQGPSVRHHYPPEAQRPDERATLYAASVEAFDASANKMATGYATVDLPNRLRAAKREQGVVQLVTEQGPVMARNEDGSRSADVALVNIDAVETVRLTEMTIRFKPCDGSDAPETSLPVESVFPETRIPPKGRLAGRLVISAEEARTVCWADARVTGETEPGHLKALGFLGGDTGQSKGIPLAAGAQDTMSRALQLLGKSGQTGTVIVTDDEIRRLEDEGKIPRAVLRPDPFVAGGQPAQ